MLVAGVTTAEDFSEFLLTILGGVGLSVALAYALLSIFGTHVAAMIVSALLFAAAGLAVGSLGGAFFGAIGGVLFARLVFWLHFREYRRGLPPYLTAEQVLWHYGFRFICAAIFIFLITPILVVLPLSFNAENFFTFTPEMLRFDPEGYSLKHYRDFFTNNEWQRSFKNSLIIAPIATIISVSLGTLAAIGLSQSHVPGRRAIMAMLISPMIVPLIISATGMFFFYSSIGNFLEDSLGFNKTFVGYVKVILAHAVLGVPFVIITVTATLVGFDRSLTRAAANMGADPMTTFFRVQMPLILPGVISGGLFAFITSFDEVVVVLFVGSASQKTLPWQMFTGLREQISPTILAVATILVVISIALLTVVELLRRRSERLRGMSPG
ncbi:ABC transporter permease [Halocynthiibacter sp. SDUM655004]|uniref:ABC transporter permease n=2 Tax=Paracoccaceae TaxID=31989 RepID=A0AAE3IYX0_9RHOB|nr:MULTISPECIES: ABC transporter permease [Halocynthiibacter]MCV6824544.1 ABC transporter permease [Halocynthiibacter halioticoli]MCW4057545.1 ABC transporter permease [Halocynthiibacter sp. SDUM655004]MDE0589418.1 ABC transporter permease [Halocynthiibacter sp. C4]